MSRPMCAVRIGRFVALLLLSFWLALGAAPMAQAQLASGPAESTDTQEPPDYKSSERTAARAVAGRSAWPRRIRRRSR